jgi:glycosyltransferase involved in cell wall biosynthesis
VLDDLKNLANNLGISQKVYFTGYLNDVQITKMYKAIDVATFPSLYEPFGIVALEGMLAGAATVVSDAGGLNEIVSHRIDGMKSYAGNANSLADSILEVLFDDNLCKQMSAKARQKVISEFNWDIISQNTMKVYKETIKEAKAGSWAKEKAKSRKDAEELGEIVATMVDGKDTTITTDTTDKEINILPTPNKKMRKATAGA